MSVLGNGQSHEKIKEEIIGSLRRDPDATDVDGLRKIINDIEAQTLIKSEVNASKIQRMNQGEHGKVAEKSKQHCQVCGKSFHLADVCWHRYRSDECAKSTWHNKVNALNTKSKVRHQDGVPEKTLSQGGGPGKGRRTLPIKPKE